VKNYKCFVRTPKILLVDVPYAKLHVAFALWRGWLTYAYLVLEITRRAPFLLFCVGGFVDSLCTAKLWVTTFYEGDPLYHPNWSWSERDN